MEKINHMKIRLTTDGQEKHFLQDEMAKRGIPTSPIPLVYERNIVTDEGLQGLARQHFDAIAPPHVTTFNGGVPELGSRDLWRKALVDTYRRVGGLFIADIEPQWTIRFATRSSASAAERDLGATWFEDAFAVAIGCYAFPFDDWGNYPDDSMRRILDRAGRLYPCGYWYAGGNGNKPWTVPDYNRVVKRCVSCWVGMNRDPEEIEPFLCPVDSANNPLHVDFISATLEMWRRQGILDCNLWLPCDDRKQAEQSLAWMDAPGVLEAFTAG